MKNDELEKLIFEEIKNCADKSKISKCLVCNKEFVKKKYNQKFCKRNHYTNCVICKKEILQKNLKSIKHGCSQSCTNKIRENTNIEKFGVSNPFSSEVIKEKIQQTNIEKYGATHRLKNENELNKHKKKMIELYGVDNPQKSKVIQNKTKKTNLEKYGAVTPLANKNIIEKTKQTNLEKYGHEHYLSSKYGKEKMKNDYFKKTGYFHPFSNPELIVKRVETFKEKYSENNYEKIKNKIKQTNLEKYGKEWYTQTDEYKDKHKKHSLKKYGYEHHFKSPIIQNKIKQTNLKKYGKEWYTQTDEYKKRYIGTCLSKYNVTHYSKTEEFINKINQTNLEKYGHPIYFKTEDYKNKSQKTLAQNYGVDNYFKSELSIKNNLKFRYNMDNINDWINFPNYIKSKSIIPSVSELSKYFLRSEKAIIDKIKRFQLFDYYPELEYYSYPELEIKNFLDNLNISYKAHDRKAIAPLELDFYLSEYKLGIEVSPTYTHKYIKNSEIIYGKIDKYYHYSKFEACFNKGIELITIFDWHDLSKIKEMITQKVRKNNITIYARNTTSKICTINKDLKEFIKSNHLLDEGKLYNKDICSLLYLDNELVQIGVFREISQNQFELKRLVTKSEYNIVGGASKILKNFINHNPLITSIITFSDNDFGSGNVYKKLGFELIKRSKGSLVWHNPKKNKKIKNLSLIRLGTDKLLKNFPGYEPIGQGENLPNNEEIIQKYGFYPVYDCGYSKWELKIDKK